MKYFQKVHPHLLKHLMATFLLEKGMPLEQIQKFLGHSKIETTQIYAQSKTEMMMEGIEKLFRDRQFLRFYKDYLIFVFSSNLPDYTKRYIRRTSSIQSFL